MLAGILPTSHTVDAERVLCLNVQYTHHHICTTHDVTCDDAVMAPFLASISTKLQAWGAISSQSITIMTPTEHLTSDYARSLTLDP